MPLCSLSHDLPHVPSTLKPLIPLLLAAAVLAVLGGCDASTLNSSEDADRAGDATEVPLADDAFARADLQYEPVSLAPGETFSIALNDARRDGPVTRLVHEGTPDGRHALKAFFAPLEPSSVTIRCHNKLAGTEQTIAERDGDAFGPGSGGQPVAKSDDDPDSYHVEVSEDGTYIGVDYAQQRTAPTFDFPGTDQPVQCTHVLFELEGVTGLAPTGVQFGGDVPAPSIQRRSVEPIARQK